MGTLALRLTGATKRYPGRNRAVGDSQAGQAGQAADQPIFQAVDLAVEAGEILALLGPSGCGKSTLLRVIAGLEPLSEGRVEIAGRFEQDAAIQNARGGPPTFAPPHPSDTGMVFQEPLLFPWLTVAENVALGLQYRANRAARPGNRAGEFVEQILHDFGLTAISSAYPDELSGGQAQRASLARTIVTRPAILLLDEPFSALDPRTRAALQDWLLDVVRRRNLTVILVTHDVEEALYLGDRVALMTSCPGTIVQTWDIAHHATPGTVSDGGADRQNRQNRRSDERLLAVRREILARYQTDVPVTTTTRSNSWVI